MYRVLCIAMLGFSLAACGSTAPDAPARGQPLAQSSGSPAQAAAHADRNAAGPEAVDPQVIQALRDMGAYLATLKRFSVDIDLDGERVLTDGQKLMHSATATLDVQRPNKLRARMRSARTERDLIYDGRTITLSLPTQKYYASAATTQNLGELVVQLRERFGIEVPVADLFLWGTPAAPLDNITSAMRAGSDYIDGQLCDQYALRQGMLDWQIWIAAGNRPLPCKLVITDRADEARPQSVTSLDWNLSPTFNDSVFRFRPAKDARKAEFVPLKNR